MQIYEIVQYLKENDELYSPIYGVVYFYKVEKGIILVRKRYGASPNEYVYSNPISFSSDGKYETDGEIMLFPSKSNHNWASLVPNYPKTYEECMQANLKKPNVMKHISDLRKGYDIYEMLKHCELAYRTAKQDIHYVVVPAVGRDSDSDDQNSFSTIYALNHATSMNNINAIKVAWLIKEIKNYDTYYGNNVRVHFAFEYHGDAQMFIENFKDLLNNPHFLKLLFYKGGLRINKQ